MTIRKLDFYLQQEVSIDGTEDKVMEAQISRAVQKAAKHTTLQMIGLTRSSSQEVAEGYGPFIQKSELIADARSQGYGVVSICDIVEPATIDLEERDLFN